MDSIVSSFQLIDVAEVCEILLCLYVSYGKLMNTSIEYRVTDVTLYYLDGMETSIQWDMYIYIPQS